MADIFWLCCRDDVDILSAIENAAGKASGIFPPVVARALEMTLAAGLPAVFWVDAPDEMEFRRGIERLIEQIMHGS